MSRILFGGQWPETPTTGSCCWGSVLDGADGCTCWEPVYDLDQQPIQKDEPVAVRGAMCIDCAYRPNSPERRGDPTAAADAEKLQALAARGTTFWCHQGIRRPTHWVHPSGVTKPGDPMNYCPPSADGIPFKADGHPADHCAGWSALSTKVRKSSEDR